MLKAVSFSLLLASVAARNPFPMKRGQTTNTKKAKTLSKIMEKATPVRKLDEDEAEVDLSAYSIKFEECTLIKQWSAAEDENGGQDGEVDDVLQSNRFALFRLCPTAYYSTCSSDYGEYLLDLETYLLSTTEYFMEQQEAMCEMCNEYCYNDDGQQMDDAEAAIAATVDCDSCIDECEKIENMEDNGYLEASNYIECAQLDQENDDDANEEEEAYYAGATCSSDGSKIKIGVFTDENCAYINNNLYVDDYLNGFKLSHALMKNVYSGTSVPCSYYDEDGEAEENEACQELYEAAAKCESSYGFSGNNGYQSANEDVVCDFIYQIKSGSFDAASGEINLTGRNTVEGGGQTTTGGQKFALTVLILGTIGLAVYAATIHSSLTKGAKADLSKQGGQMA